MNCSRFVLQISNIRVCTSQCLFEFYQSPEFAFGIWNQAKIILRIFYCNALSKHKDFIFCFNLNLIVKCLFLSFFLFKKNVITVFVKLEYDIVLKYIKKFSFSKVLADVGKKKYISFRIALSTKKNPQKHNYLQIQK